MKCSVELHGVVEGGGGENCAEEHGPVGGALLENYVVGVRGGRFIAGTGFEAWESAHLGQLL